jgi:hypothetical protein
MRSRLFFILGVSCLLLLADQLLGLGQEVSKETAKHVENARKLAAANKLVEAAGAMKEAVRLAPGNADLLAMASEMEYKAGLFADGLEHARQAIKINGKVGTYHVLAAANAYGTQDLAAAREYVLTVLKGGAVFAPAVASARRVEGLLVKKTYTLDWELNPKKGQSEGGLYRLAMPQGDLPYQSLTYKVTGAKSHRLIKTEVNDVLLVVPQGNKPFQVSMQISRTPYLYKERLASRKAGPVPAAVRPYLGPSAGLNPGSPAMQKVARGLKTADPVRTINNIIAWLKKNIEYKISSKFIDKPDFKSADELLQRGHAECMGYALVFTGLCRACGLPARLVWGIYMKPDGSGFGSHNWSEVHIGGVGWVPIDPQVPETFGLWPNSYLRFFMPMQRTARSNEAQPNANLLYMSGDNFKYQTKAESLVDSRSSRP